MNVLLLGGGPLPPGLASPGGPTERPLLPCGGRPLLAWLLDALRQCPEVETVALVAGPATLQWAAAEGVTGRPAGPLLSRNLLDGLELLPPGQVLVAACDIPLVSGATFTTLLQGTAQRGLELAYPIVPRPAVEQQFPHGKRTYVRLREGTFTGGNAFVVPTAAVPRLVDLVEQAFTARKNPVALARLLGGGFLLGLLAGNLRLAQLEEKISRLCQVRAGAVVLQDAAIGFDVDKPADLALVETMLLNHRQGGNTK